MYINKYLIIKTILKYSCYYPSIDGGSSIEWVHFGNTYHKTNLIVHFCGCYCTIKVLIGCECSGQNGKLSD